eukprot:COSAG05_NODE_892_length_6724_cov_32.630491_8_plen_94_part_01
MPREMKGTLTFTEQGVMVSKRTFERHRSNDDDKAQQQNLGLGHGCEEIGGKSGLPGAVEQQGPQTVEETKQAEPRPVSPSPSPSPPPPPPPPPP